MKTVKVALIVLPQGIISISVQYTYGIVLDHVISISITPRDILFISEVAVRLIQGGIIHTPRKVGYHHELATGDVIEFWVNPALSPCGFVSFESTTRTFCQVLISFIVQSVIHWEHTGIPSTTLCVCVCVIRTRDVQKDLLIALGSAVQSLHDHTGQLLKISLTIIKRAWVH